MPRKKAATETQVGLLTGVRHVDLETASDSTPVRVSSGGVGSDIIVTGEGDFINTTSFPTDALSDAFRDQYPEVAGLINWSNEVKSRPRTGAGGLFERDRYVAPTRVFDQMVAAQYATENDDVCSGVLESSEALAFSKMSIECWDEDEEDIWNQIAEDLDLDSRLREMWRELFSVSQFYVSMYMGTKSYTVRGRSPKGVKRKRTFSNLKVPLGLTLLDPLSVIPVGSMLFNQDQLAFISNAWEAENVIEPAITNPASDPIVANMFIGKYKVSDIERRDLAAAGVPNTDFLYLMNPKTTWRHTDTRPQYRRWASVRMKSVFDILDLKTQLKEMDRATLLGSANFLVVVKKGSKEEPAKPQELENLQQNMRLMARVPFIFGDHRLSIEIITPDNSNTLKPDRYQAVNSQIFTRLFQMFVNQGASAGRGDDSLKLGRVIARGLENRRGQLQRKIERMVLDPVYDGNELFTAPPTLQFHPRQIALDFDAGLATFMMDLRDRREISRATLLSQVDLSEVEEGRKREREKEHYDGVFETLTPIIDPDKQLDNQLAVIDATPDPVAPAAPAKTPARKADTKTGGGGNTDPKGAGRTGGGNRNGGGSAPGSGQGQAPDPRRKAKSAPKSTK